MNISARAIGSGAGFKKLSRFAGVEDRGGRLAAGFDDIDNAALVLE
jgi:hypothetical protein